MKFNPKQLIAKYMRARNSPDRLVFAKKVDSGIVLYKKSQEDNPVYELKLKADFSVAVADIIFAVCALVTLAALADIVACTCFHLKYKRRRRL